MELGPNDGDVIVLAALYATMQKDYVQAEHLLERARNEHPDRQDVYLQFAELKRSQGKVQEGAEELKVGLKKATDTQLILEALVDYQLQLNDIKGAEATCEQMKDKLPQELMRFHRGRIEFSQGKFLEACRDLEAVRPAIARISYKNYSQQLDVMLGVCYEQVGMWDRELEVFREVLRTYPDIMRARLGEAMALDNLGRYDEAAVSLKALTEGIKDFPYLALPVFQLLANAQMHKPADQRDWSNVEKVAELVYQQKDRNELDNVLMKADVLMFQDRNVEARKLLTQAVTKYPKDVRGWTSLARAAARDEETAKKLPQLLDRAEKAVGDVMPLRAMRIREIALHSGDHAVDDLKKLEVGLDKFPSVSQRASLMNQLGMAYVQVRDFPDAKRCWRYVAEQAPEQRARLAVTVRTIGR